MLTEGDESLIKEATISARLFATLCSCKYHARRDTSYPGVATPEGSVLDCRNLTSSCVYSGNDSQSSRRRGATRPGHQPKTD